MIIDTSKTIAYKCSSVARFNLSTYHSLKCQAKKKAVLPVDAMAHHWL